MAAFFDLVRARIAATNGSLLMVGLDCHAQDLKEQTGDAAFAFCKRLIDETKHVAIGYKPNAAFFERLGADGVAALKRVIAYVPDDIPVLLDVKRGDIGSTCTAYAEAAYRDLGAHGVTLSAYMGRDSVAPFLAEEYAGRSIFLLCKTSNATSNEVQTLRLADGGQMLYERMAGLAQSWNAGGNVGLVVGATDVEAMRRTRAAAPDLWILAPGVGAQGGDLKAALLAGLRAAGRGGDGIIVPVSRGVSRAASPRAAAEELAAAMRAARAEAAAEAATEAVQTPSPAGALEPYQRRFIQSALEMKVLRFGSFTLKSGRESPYFFNAGLFCSGAAMNDVAECYAEAVERSGLEFDVIFGPAYKGIPLAACIAMALSRRTGRPVPWAYNRKEKKDHGEGGTLVGADMRGKRALVVDDVITAGTAIRESVAMLATIDARVSGVVVALDRQEVTSTSGDMSAIEALSAEKGIRVVSVAGLSHLIAFCGEQGGMDAHLESIKRYRSKYGSKSAKTAGA